MIPTAPLGSRVITFLVMGGSSPETSSRCATPALDVAGRDISDKRARRCSASTSRSPVQFLDWMGSPPPTVPDIRQSLLASANPIIDENLDASSPGTLELAVVASLFAILIAYASLGIVGRA
jgi:hypothetical protein